MLLLIVMFPSTIERPDDLFLHCIIVLALIIIHCEIFLIPYQASARLLFVCSCLRPQSVKCIIPL